MKIKLSKSQWEFVGKKTGWIKSSQSTNSPVLTEDRLVTFFDENTGNILAKETFVIEGKDETERFSKLNEIINDYIINNFDNPDAVDYEDELINVTG